MYIPITLQQQDTTAVVDTAAQISVMSRKFYDKITPKPMLRDRLVLKGVGDSSEINGWITDTVKIRIGNGIRKWKMVVAEITDDVILGLDFLTDQKAVIDLNDFTVQIQGVAVPSKIHLLSKLQRE